MYVNLLRLVISGCKTTGDVPFYTLFLQGPVFFNEYVLLFCKPGKLSRSAETGHQEAAASAI